MSGARRRGIDAYEHSQMGRFARLVAVHAGIGEPSTSGMLADRLAESARRALETTGRVATVEVIALRSLAAEIARAGIGAPVAAPLQAVLDAVSGADGVIVVSPVFQASYSGLFKSFMDILPEDALRAMPVLVGASAGTARHSLVTEFAMRPLLAHMRAIPTARSVFAASEDFGAAWNEAGLADERRAPLGERIDRAGAELADLIERFPRRAPVDAMSDFTPMGELLGRGRQPSADGASDEG